MAMDMLEGVRRTYSIDEGRIYVTGHSMGAVGTFAALAHYPETFAAGVVRRDGCDRRRRDDSFQPRILRRHPDLFLDQPETVRRRPGNRICRVGLLPPQPVHSGHTDRAVLSQPHRSAIDGN